MIRLFDTTNPVALIYLFVYAVALKVGLFAYADSLALAPSNAPLTVIVYQLVGTYKWLIIGASVLLIFLQAFLINRFLNRLKLFNRLSYIPAIIYVLIASFFPEYLLLSPVMLANTFIVFILDSLFALFRKKQAAGDIFDAGFLISICSLFYLPAIMLIIPLFVALVILRQFNWREWVIASTGLFTPYFLLGTVHYWNDNLASFMMSHFTMDWSNYSIDINFGVAFIVLSSLYLLIILGSMFYLWITLMKNPIEIRRYLTLAIWLLVALATSAHLSETLTLGHFAILSVPLSISIMYLVMNTQRMKILEWIHGILLIIVLFFQYFPLIF